MEKITIEDKLPFSELKQAALLGFLITDEKFFKIIYTRIRPEWFLSDKNSKLFQYFSAYYEEYKFFPSIHGFRSYKKFDSMDTKQRMQIQGWIDNALAAAAQFRLDDLKKDFTEWLHSVIMISALNKASGLFNRQEIKQCYSILSEAVKEVNTSFFFAENQMTFGNFESYIKDFEVQKDNALTTGLSILDQALLKGATVGGMLPGDTTIFMAPQNIGKSTAMQTIACHNVRRGKDVLYMTHEGNPDYIRLMFLANMIGTSVDNIFVLRGTPEGREKIRQASQALEKHLKYIPYNKANKMVVEEVIPVIIGNHEQWKSEKGNGFHLLVSDYPAVLSSELAYRGTLQKRNIDQVIYNHYIQLGIEYKFHVLAAIQTNRDGAKVNKHLNGENRLLVPEDVQESFGPIQQANNIITYNRSLLAEKLGLGTFGIGKTRTNRKGQAVIARSNFPNSITHSNELGGMLYTGNKTIEDKYASLESRFKNSEIPDGALKGLV